MIRPLWCSTSSPPREDFDHWNPTLTTAEVGSLRSDELLDRLLDLAAPLGLAERAALLSLLPWFAAWTHYVCAIASKLPNATFSRIVASDLSALDTRILRRWAEHLGTPFEVAPTAAAATGPTPRARPPVGAILRATRPRTPARTLLLGLQSNSAQALLPLGRELAARDEAFVFGVLGSEGDSLPRVQAEKFPVVALETQLPWSSPLRAPGALAALRRLGRSAEIWEIVARPHLPVWLTPKDAAVLLRPSLERRFWTAWAKALALDNLLRKIRPELVVFASDHGLVSHLLEGHPEIRRALHLQGVVPPVPRVRQRLPVDAAFVGSELDEDYTRSISVPDELVVRTGYGGYERLTSLSRDEARRTLRQRLRTREDSPIVCFTSQYPTDLFPDWARRRNLAVLFDAARRTPELTFAVKLHPRREVLSAAERRELPENVVLLDGPFDIALLLAGSDVAVTYWSTTALEALLVGTPLIQLNATGLSDYYPLTNRYGLPPVRNVDDLTRTLRTVTSAEGSASLRARQRTFLDGAEIPPPAEFPSRFAKGLLALRRSTERNRDAPR